MIRDNTHWNKKKIYKISWEKFDLYSENLFRKIKLDKFEPDIIIGIMRGGIFPAIKLSHYFEKHDIGIINFKSNKKDSIYSTSEGVEFYWSNIPDIYNKKILLVDDIVGSGTTLVKSIEFLGSKNPKEIKSCSLVLNVKSSLSPNYYLYSVDDWVLFPWEHLEYEKKYKDQLRMKEISIYDISVLKKKE